MREIFEKIENIKAISSIRNGFVAIMPIILIGAGALVFINLPIGVYQDFIANSFGGVILRMLNIIHSATFCRVSVYLTLAISMYYIRAMGEKNISITAPFTALMCFLILGNFNMSEDYLGVKGIFMAIIVALVSTKSVVWLYRHIKFGKKAYIDSSDKVFNRSVMLITPIFLTLALFTALDIGITTCFNVENSFELFSKVFTVLFERMGRNFGSALLTVFLIDFLWFFGIHGSNMLQSVTESVFEPAIYENMRALEAGRIPTEVFTKQFFDTFILVGGCGATMSLLIAILLFSKRKNTRQLSKFAGVSMLFNINELMVFGLPIIFNPVMFIPFICVPIVFFIISYFAMSTGLVPVTVNQVNWTTPVIISGYLATNSIRGSILQIVNIAVGVMIYRPFVLEHDKMQAKSALKVYDELVGKLKKSEEEVSSITLIELSGKQGRMARDISSDLKYALENDKLKMCYQPQCDDEKRYIGAEALLRWYHPVYGMIYPPLAIKLAAENGFLAELEEYVILKAVKDGKRIYEQTGVRKEIGVNVSAQTFKSEGFYELAKRVATDYNLQKGDVCFEITEQTSLFSDTDTTVGDKLNDIKSLGYTLAIDDFSMGHTSIKYLQDNQFDVVKLDGVLVRNMQTNTRNLEIVKSIVAMSASLGFDVIAEFVENEEQVEVLSKIGCKRYQGYLYSPAVPCDEIITMLGKRD